MSWNTPSFLLIAGSAISLMILLWQILKDLPNLAAPNNLRKRVGLTLLAGSGFALAAVYVEQNRQDIMKKQQAMDAQILPVLKEQADTEHARAYVRHFRVEYRDACVTIATEVRKEFLLRGYGPNGTNRLTKGWETLQKHQPKMIEKTAEFTEALSWGKKAFNSSGASTIIGEAEMIADGVRHDAIDTLSGPVPVTVRTLEDLELERRKVVRVMETAGQHLSQEPQ